MIDFAPKKCRFFEKNGYIYIDFVDNGKRVRKSLNLEYNQKNLKSVEKNKERVLSNFLNVKQQQKKASLNFHTFGLEVLRLSSFNRQKRTQGDYISKFERLISPYFENYQIDEILATHIDAWQQELLKNNSTTTVKRCKTLLKLIFDKAIANQYIQVNPVPFTFKFNVLHKHQEPYSLKEMQKILLNVSDGWLKIFLYLAFCSGLRVGELLALQKNDIDFENGVIRLKRSITKGVVTETTSTKNHNRLIILPHLVLEMLKNYCAITNSIWVFPGKMLDKPIYEPKSIVKNHFKPLLQRIGVPYKTLKATRHTYISIMRNYGASQDLILEIAGHSKEVQDKHYYTAEMTSPKALAVNNVFDKVLGLGTIVTP